MDEKRLNEIKSKLFKKCVTCDYFGPNFGICFKKSIGPGWSSRGICDEYQPLNDNELLEYTDEELEDNRFFEF